MQHTFVDAQRAAGRQRTVDVDQLPVAQRRLRRQRVPVRRVEQRHRERECRLAVDATTRARHRFGQAGVQRGPGAQQQEVAFEAAEAEQLAAALQCWHEVRIVVLRRVLPVRGGVPGDPRTQGRKARHEPALVAFAPARHRHGHLRGGVHGTVTCMSGSNSGA
ncbi:MAG: hypothetical protein KIS72_10635, partial [Luteimonas sp.]|nr:hypothetical protein [Luteimonas sp.]